MPSTFPVSSVDPFADDFLAEPYPFYEELREAGPVVWLERYGLWACARHAEVQAVLSDWETYTSAAGVGIDDFRRSKPWRPPSLLLEADPPLHTRTRTVMNRALSARAIAGLRASFHDAAESLADNLLARGRVDAVKDVGEAYPLSVFPKAIGLGSDGLENLLPYGAMVFNGFGPRNAHFNDAMAAAAKVVPYINGECAREALSPDGLGATIWAAVDTGEITAEEAPLLVRSLLSAGLDTTVVAIGSALYGFATNPEQWAALRQNRGLTRPAFDEMLRWESPIQTFFRTTTKPVDLGGVEVPADAKILLFLGSANRDPRKWNEPERFDVTRRATGHVAFGAGIHLCVGQMLARLETEMIIAALAARVERIDVVGEPRRKLSNSLRQFASLPIELKPA